MCLTKQFSGSEGARSLLFASSLYPTAIQHTSPKGRLVQPGRQNGLMHFLEVAQRKLVRQQGKSYRSISELSLQSGPRKIDDCIMVEGQWRFIYVDWYQPQVVATRHRSLQAIRWEQSEIGDRNDPHTRITRRIAKTV